MYKNILKYASAAAVFCLYCGCDKRDGTPGFPDEPLMSFATGVTTASRSAGTTDESLKEESIGIYGLYSASETEGGTFVFGNSNATELKYVSGASPEDWKWEYSPLRYWKRNQIYRFRAFHPYRFADGSRNADLFESGSGADRIVLNYAMTPGAVGSWNNYDLLVAFNSRNTFEGTDAERFATVPMKFSHALSALRFRVTYKENNGYRGYLNKFWIKGLRAYGTMTYSHVRDNVLEPETVWTAQYYTEDKDYFIWESGPGNEKTFTHPDYVNSPEESAAGLAVGPANVYASDDDVEGLIFVVPQTCSAPRHDGSGKDFTTVSFMTLKSGDAVNTINLPTQVWEPGKIYTYTLEMGTSNIIVDVSSMDWELVESDITIDL